MEHHNTSVNYPQIQYPETRQKSLSIVDCDFIVTRFALFLRSFSDELSRLLHSITIEPNSLGRL